ncbi:transmembrane protein 218 isoform X1 [Betta splendens]|uniref:Transmembrane protein 218 n=1 Tax=Betta splendens TaxID=158456 RepID=A0A8M1HMN3_BETSP|nr:transmembrane protein 218 isoform X1 [Betta splendens]
MEQQRSEGGTTLPAIYHHHLIDVHKNGFTVRTPDRFSSDIGGLHVRVFNAQNVALVNVQLGVIPIFLVALTITLVLVFFPRSQETVPPFKQIEIVDTLFIGRYVLLAVVSAVFLVAFFMLLPLHFLEPVYAKALRTH